MQAIARIVPTGKAVVALAALTFSAGVGGMAISFLYLASGHPLDVLAGAAGFVAGSILAAAGLVSISVPWPVPLTGEPTAAADNGLAVLDPPLAVDRWLAYFQSNRLNRPEPDWNAPRT